MEGTVPSLRIETARSLVAAATYSASPSPFRGVYQLTSVQRCVFAITVMALLLLTTTQTGFARPAVRPPAVGTPPIELGELIALALPVAGSRAPGWGYMESAPIAWRRGSFERDTQGNTVRVGLARVRVNGQISTKLGRHPAEVAWTVMLQGSPNPAHGVNGVHIEPGELDQHCVGSGFANCVFQPEDVYSGTNAQHQRVCFVGAEDAYQSVYAISAPGRRPGYVVFTRSPSSEGETTWIDVSWSGPAPNCQDPIG
jgi:hypothetical protein